MKKIFLALMLTLLPFCALAASESENIINQQNQVIQNQKQIDQEREIQLELKQVKKEQIAKEQQEEELEPDDLSENDGKVVQNLRSIQCFRPREINFSKNQILSKDEEKSLSEKYLNRCFTLDWLPKFDQEVIELMTEKGFTTSKSTTSQKSLMSGRMQVEITEGMLEKIIINQDSFTDQIQLRTIFGFDDLPKGGKILNINDINYALERFNRLRSNKVSVKVIPGSAPNKSIIVIENNPQNTARIALSYDNIGSKSTGVKRDTISFAKDNLLHINDVFSLTRTANDLDSKNDVRTNTAINASWSVPFAQHLITLSMARNTYFFLTGSNGDVRANGVTESRTVNWDNLITKNKKYKLSSALSFTTRDNQIFTDNILNETQSRKASILTASLSNSFYLDAGTLFVKPSYIKALGILNAKKDKEVSANSNRPEFEMVKIYANYSQKFMLPYFENQAMYNLTFDSQYSKDHLYSIDQFSSGGFYSVRGFRSGNISGDSGFNLRNEVSFNLGQMILPQLSQEKKSSSLNYLNNFSIMPFYDFGRVENRDTNRSGRLSSTGFKLSFAKDKICSSLTFSHALSRSLAMNKNARFDNTIYFDVTTEMEFL